MLNRVLLSGKTTYFGLRVMICVEPSSLVICILNICSTVPTYKAYEYNGLPVSCCKDLFDSYLS